MIMFFVVRSNDRFNFPLGLIKYIVIIVNYQLQTLLLLDMITVSIENSGCDYCIHCISTAAAGLM